MFRAVLAVVMTGLFTIAVCAAEDASPEQAQGAALSDTDFSDTDATQGAAPFRREVAPLLAKYCSDCHGQGTATADVAFDQFTSDAQLLESRGLWWKALKQLRADLMPPQGEARPSSDEIRRIESWIKSAVFQIDPQNPDPGRVTVRRLNRVEYRNTIRDLLGVEYDTSGEFPADDTGYGFDNIGDVLTISPLLLEKYIAAAEAIVKQADEKRLYGVGIAATQQEAGETPVLPKEAGGTPRPQIANRQFAIDVLTSFAARALRRPPDAETVERLVRLAENIAGEPGRDLKDGIKRAITAILASPRFLFREEAIEPAPPGMHPLIDEWSLASRLSYFLWSTMPDEELFRLANEHKLRENLPAQVQRMLADSRSKELIRQFTGQWLQARDIDSVDINAFAVIAGDRPADPELERRRARLRELRSRPFESLTPEEKADVDAAREAFRAGRERVRQFELNGDLRRAMRSETEMLFAHILREDRSLLDLLECNYAFLNERLARHYGIEGVQGNDMRLVQLPAESPRGGILTQGTVLAVTSNPDRTSPVKRGLFILDNVLGTPSPPPPPNVPPLEDAAKRIAGRSPTLREQLELHRSEALCSSCHNRLDPLGLALEDFNALGMLRESRPERVIDTSGRLLTGESFRDIRELKHILATTRRLDFYRCLTEKLLIYALGRGLDYYDVFTVDQLVDRLNAEKGRASILISGIIESVPFQRRRSQWTGP
jgi:mono/diheme cytochrome c family protein